MNENANRRQTLRDDELDPALSEVSRTVIGCAIEIHKELGPGFDRSVYENALAADLKAKNVEHRLRPEIEVLYNDQEVGRFTVSLEVDDRFVVEILSDPNDVGGIERDALRAKIKNAELDMGLIVNFARRRLRDGLVRVLNPERIDELRGEGSDDDDHDDDSEG
ncbi:MAG: GxxExxY protein [Planctomycetota bacterium]